MGYLSTRRPGLDTLRGMTLVSMMVYHACWIWSIFLGRIGHGTAPLAPISGSRASAGRLFCSLATVFIWDITGCGADFYPWAEGRW